jgi:glycosyltransferase involved in cell wall biosynthesis
MRAVQLFRKIDPAEWGGTETAMHRLFSGLQETGVTPVIFCPRVPRPGPDPFTESGFRVERFKAFVPIVGMSQERKRQLVAVGGNLMSFDLISMLLRERDVDLVHAHALGRIGAIGRTVARRRNIPFVVTIHGGLLDLPPAVKASFNAPNDQGFDWGKLFSLLFQSHRLLADADAVLTCNEREAELLRERHPEKRIVCQPHAVPIEIYEQNHRDTAMAAWPAIKGRQIILSLGRIDPIKNQGWLIDRSAPILARNPDTMLVLAGACTDEPYGRMIDAKVAGSGFGDRILLTGGLGATDPRLIGLLQSAAVLVLPSLSETFGLVLLEAWAAGTTVMSSRTSGGQAMIDHGENGWLFDLDAPAAFQEKLQLTLSDPQMRKRMADHGARKARTRYSIGAVASQVRSLYENLIGEKRCAT